MKPLEDIIGVVADFAVREFISRTDHNRIGLAHVIGFPRDPAARCIVIGINMGPDDKRELAAFARDKLIEHGCDCFAFVSECWISTRSGDDPNVAMQPKDDPLRKDGLQILVGTADVAVQTSYIIREIDHAPGVELVRHSTLDSRRHGEGCGGRWAQLLAPQFDPTGKIGFFDHEGFHFADPLQHWKLS